MSHSVATPDRTALPISQYDPQMPDALWLIPATALKPQEFCLIKEIALQPGKLPSHVQQTDAAQLDAKLDQALHDACEQFAIDGFGRWENAHKNILGPLVDITEQDILSPALPQYGYEVVCSACQPHTQANCPHCGGTGYQHQLGRIKVEFYKPVYGSSIHGDKNMPIDGLHELVSEHVTTDELLKFADRITGRDFHCSPLRRKGAFLVVSFVHVDLPVQITPTPAGNRYAFGYQRVTVTPKTTNPAAQVKQPIPPSTHGLGGAKPNGKTGQSRTGTTDHTDFWHKYLGNFASPNQLLLIALLATLVLDSVLLQFVLYGVAVDTILAAAVTAGWYRACKSLLPEYPSYMRVLVTFILVFIVNSIPLNRILWRYLYL